MNLIQKSKSNVSLYNRVHSHHREPGGGHDVSVSKAREVFFFNSKARLDHASFKQSQNRGEKLTWCFWSAAGGDTRAEYLCPVFRGIVGPRLSTEPSLSDGGGSESSFLIEFIASFSTDGFLGLRPRDADLESFPSLLSFPSLGLCRSFLKLMISNFFSL